ncbi:MAG: FAD-dependent oxidoreductase [Myxococcales bacterium]|nr:FAD-dependent oxidoreductase [Myxococcales bacterium]
MADERCDVLILGASFAGIELVHQLRKSRAGRALKITVVDRQPLHGYIPLVQERLVGRLPREASALATARAVEAAGQRYVVGDVVGLDVDAKAATLASGERLVGRFVVVALGSVLAAPPGLEGRELLRGYKFEREFAETLEYLQALLGGGEPPAPPVGLGGGAEHPYREGVAAPSRRLVVIGGGISGVELAGELAHLARVRPANWRVPEVSLIQSGERLLPHLSERAGRRAERHLREQGVDVRLRTRVVRVLPAAVALHGANGAEDLACAGAFWAGGVRPAPVLAGFDVPHTRDGWLAVGPTLQCFPTPRPTRPDIFACGDAVRVVGGTGEWPTMQRAIECIWQAKVVARNLLRLAAEPATYPRGVPSLLPHRLREDFPHGVSIGGASLVVYGRLMFDQATINTWFRRFLMRQYFARYAPRTP